MQVDDAEEKLAQMEAQMATPPASPARTGHQNAADSADSLRECKVLLDTLQGKQVGKVRCSGV